MPLRLVSRDEWKARRGDDELRPLNLPVPAVYIQYYTRTPACNGDKECLKTMKSMQLHHMNSLYYMDIQYNFYIGQDGTVYEGRGWLIDSTKQDIRFIDYYEKTIDIAFIGDYQEIDPPPAMIKAAKDLIDYGISAHFICKDYELIENRKDIVMPYDPEWEESYGIQNDFEHCHVGCGR